MSLSASLALLLLVPAAAPAAAQPGSALERFFNRRHRRFGNGERHPVGKHAMRDRSRGRMDSKGALLLDQVVEEEGKPARRRTWRLVRSGANRVTGTISDAKGPVAGELSGSTLRLKYRLAEGPSVEQWITLQPGGRAATNRMAFHRFGLKVATVESVIRKVD